VLSVFDGNLRLEEIRDLTNKIATDCFFVSFSIFFTHYMEGTKSKPNRFLAAAAIRF